MLQVDSEQRTTMRINTQLLGVHRFCFNDCVGASVPPSSSCYKPFVFFLLASFKDRTKTVAIFFLNCLNLNNNNKYKAIENR